MQRHVPHALSRPFLALVFFGVLGFMAFEGRWKAAPAQTPRSSGESAIRFEEVAHASGVDFVHQGCQLDPKVAHIEAEMAAMGAAVAVTDADGDGWSDFYTTTSRFGAKNALYHNLKDGQFQDVAESAGLADLNRREDGASMGAIFGDIDGDGDEDGYVYKWGYAQLFRNEGGLRYSDRTREAGLRQWINANTAVWLDYDRDGALDLFTAGYYPESVNLYALESTRVRLNSFEFASNGGRKRLFHNLGDGRFEEVSELLGQTVTRWTLGAAAADFDGDGWPDLYVANDYGAEELFLNRQGKRFEAQTGVGLEESSKSGMCVAVGDFQNSGALGTYVTNISKQGFVFQGNNLRSNELAQGGKLHNVADDQGGAIAECGWAWGAQFGDFDLDGWADLFVANGFISASKERDYWYQMSKVSVGTGDIFADAVSWPPIEDRSLSGYERSSVLKNLAGKRWREVAEQAQVTDLYDGRSVALVDLWNRGVLDVLVANQRGPLLIYKNVGADARRSLALELVGARPNTSAIGAQVTLSFGGKRQTRVIDGGSGFCSQNGRRLVFGLGEAPRAEQVLVRWPSGREQELGPAPAGARLRIEEGQAAVELPREAR